MIDKDTYSKKVEFLGAKGLIFIGDKVILFQRDSKTNNFPLQVDLIGGGREEGESPWETFKRETREELGIEINEEDVCFSKKYPSIFDATKEAYFIVVKPKDIKESDIVFGDEGLEYILMAPKEFVLLDDGVKRQQDKVAKYLNFLE